MGTVFCLFFVCLSLFVGSSVERLGGMIYVVTREIPFFYERELRWSLLSWSCVCVLGSHVRGLVVYGCCWTESADLPRIYTSKHPIEAIYVP
jgi:hypothetical protein